MQAATDTSSGDAPAARGVPLLAVLTVAALACGALLGAELYVLGHLGLPLDDGWIHLQFARSLAQGQGLAYNPGERVAGSTAPLWTALLSLGFLLRVPPLAWAQALGVAFQLATVAGVYRLARELVLPRTLAALAAALVATCGALLWSALSGMEVPLFGALATWGMALHARERGAVARGPGAATAPPASAALLALAPLARPEGVLLLLLALGDRALVAAREDDGELRLRLPEPRAWASALLLAAVALLPTLLAYHALGGSWLPTTFDTKAGYSAPGLPRLQYLHEVSGILAAALPLAALLAPAGALALVARAGTARDRGLLPVLWAAALPLAYGVLSGGGRGIFGNFGRYYYPLLPVVAVLGVAALAPPLELLPHRVRLGPLAASWPLWAGVLLLAVNVVALVPAVGRYLQNLRDVESGDVRLARELGPRLPAQATLAVDDIGALKFLLPNRIVDMAGIVTPQVHAYARRSLAQTGSFCPGLVDFLRATRPDYLVAFPRRYACLDGAEFPPLLRLDLPDNITLGEGTLVLHATPWTRYPLHAPAAPPR